MAVNIPRSFPQLRWQDLHPVKGGIRWQDIVEDSHVNLTFSGRGAIFQYLHHLSTTGGSRARRSVVLVPAFHCPTVVDPVLHANYEVRYYTIASDLSIDSNDLLNKLDGRVAAVIFINYFGLSIPEDHLRETVRAGGAKIVDDVSHSFLIANPLRLAHLSDADATIYSFWKQIPSLVGGGVYVASRNNLGSRSRSVPFNVSSTHYETLVRQLFQTQIEIYRRATKKPSQRCDEEKVDISEPVTRKVASDAYPYDREASLWGIPWFAKTILRVVDLRGIVDSRRSNFDAFLSTLEFGRDVAPVARALPKSAVPWGFPLFLRERSARDYRIRGSGVPVFSFGEVLHPTLFRRGGERDMIDQALYLSNSLLILANHQNLALGEIQTFADRVNQFMATLPHE